MTADFLQLTFLGNTVADYGLAVAMLVIGAIAANLLKRLVIRQVKQWASRTTTDLDDRLIRLLERPTLWLFYLGIFYVSVHNLALHQILSEAITVVSVILATFLIVQLAGSLVEYSIRLYWFTHRDHPNLQQSLSALIPAIRVVLWVIGIIFVLDNLGFDISAVVAGLGIGGVAVALASQGILQDLFSYFSILLDQPFEIGDFISIGELAGTVEHIGIKTTRLASIDGEQWVIANTDLTGSRIQNFRRMARRRIVFSLGITYETDLDKVEQVPALMEAAIAETPNVTFDRSHFANFGDFSLNFEGVYYVETNDYATYMDAQQAINFRLKAAFEQAGIEFAYPTQVLYLQQPDASQITPTGNGSLLTNGAAYG